MRTRALLKRLRKSLKKRFSRKMRGGAAYGISPAGVDDASMMGPSSQSLAQGQDYKAIHAGQYGGGAPMMPAPIDAPTVALESADLRSIAGVATLDKSIAAIQGMSDQSGGGRRRKGRKGSRKSRKGRKASRKGRKASRRCMYGGGGYQAATPADYSSPGMLLSPDAEARALMGMNKEWALAADPTSFAPKLSA
jgi:hypothetical protein